MKRKIFIILICVLVFPLNVNALDIEKNWNTYTEILPNAVVGQEYNYQLSTTEKDITEYNESLTREKLDSNYIYIIDENAILPEGLEFTNGTISGIPTKAGTYSFYVTCKKGTSGTILSSQVFYGVRYLATLFTITVDETETDLSKELTVNYGEKKAIFDKSFNKITNNGNLSIIRGTSNYNQEGYTITNNEDIYLYDVSFLNGKSVIYNKDDMTLDTVSFHYNESEDYIIYNEDQLFLNNVSFSNNKGSEYSIYNEDGNIILTGNLNVTLLNYDYDKDAIYIGDSSNFYFDIKNGNSTLTDYSKLRGHYADNLNVIINKTWDTDKEFVLIENYKTKYKFKSNLIQNSVVYKDKPQITFVTTSDYDNYKTINSIKPDSSFTYNGYSYNLITDTTNSKLILKITKVGEQTETDETEDILDLIKPKLATAEQNTTTEENTTTYTGDRIEKELNITNIIILSSTVLVLGVVIIIVLKKRNKGKC